METLPAAGKHLCAKDRVCEMELMQAHEVPQLRIREPGRSWTTIESFRALRQPLLLAELTEFVIQMR